VIGLGFNLIAAVGIGMLLAAALFVLGMARDPVRRVYLGNRVHSKAQRPSWQLQQLEQEGHQIAVLELQGALFFGACVRLQSEVARLLAQSVRFLILDLRYLGSVDSSGTESLLGIAEQCRQAGGQLSISCLEPERRVRGPGRGEGGDGGENRQLQERRRRQQELRLVWLNLVAGGVIDRLGENAVFDTTNHALMHAEEHLLTDRDHPDQQLLREVIGLSRIFTDLTPEQVGLLGHSVQRRRFKAGEIIFRQGDRGNEAYFLLRGRAEATIKIPGSSRNHHIATFVAGSLFGEMSLLDGAPRSATLRAVEKTQCLSIDADGFHTFEQASPEGALTLLRNLACQFAERLRMANTAISELER
jgi:anti-anti-sigma factor